MLREQVPRLRGRYDVACVYAGVNDVRGPDFDAAAYERDLRAIAAAAHAASARLVLCTLPEDLGRPRAAPKPARASAIVRRLATETGAGVVALDDLAGAPWLLPDAVHPTAVGQLEIADRAARVLGAPRLPSATVEVHRSRRARGRFAARHGVLLAGDLRRRAVERVRALAAQSRARTRRNFEHAVVAGAARGRPRLSGSDGEGREADRRAATDELQAADRTAAARARWTAIAARPAVTGRACPSACRGLARRATGPARRRGARTGERSVSMARVRSVSSPARPGRTDRPPHVGAQVGGPHAVAVDRHVPEHCARASDRRRDADPGRRCSTRAATKLPARATGCAAAGAPAAPSCAGAPSRRGGGGASSPVQRDGGSRRPPRPRRGPPARARRSARAGPSLVQRQRGEDRDDGDSAQPSKATASPSPGICQTASAVTSSAPMSTGASANVSVVREQQRDEHERRVEERRDLRDGVLDDRDREVRLALVGAA